VTVCWFALFRQPEQTVSAAEYERLRGLLAATPGLAQGLIFTPESTHDPYLNDGAPPALGLQLYFDEIAALEAALGSDSPLQILAGPDILPSLTGAEVSQQAMLVRRFPVPEPRPGTEAGARSCTYLVAYEGAADDLSAWLAHYIGQHPPIMARFPGIRQIEIYTRLDWCGGLSWPRVEHMQRNKVVFDSAAALTAALNSPVRHEMRADFANFPPFSGPVTHFPLATETVIPIL
jgi:uncharacterized protein (TIGR02118 family)